MGELAHSPVTDTPRLADQCPLHLARAVRAACHSHARTERAGGGWAAACRLHLAQHELEDGVCQCARGVRASARVCACLRGRGRACVCASVCLCLCLSARANSGWVRARAVVCVDARGWVRARACVSRAQRACSRRARTMHACTRFFVSYLCAPAGVSAGARAHAGKRVRAPTFCLCRAEVSMKGQPHCAASASPASTLDYPMSTP
jgi:hypothetical protein